jgi:hypothetical protein
MVKQNYIEMKSSMSQPTNIGMTKDHARFHKTIKEKL